ncbi:hypothetical protein G205_18599 [Arthrobacter nitrophenolicus]|uniref:Uncharacterized protein n=1 Tax=Arthrobacter nitrophenolicus TaxID=683150 RepID=L8TNW7_9MICC|nr:hypothetical protein G205_18599 [Arthrobacter nitrophenolicus]
MHSGDAGRAAVRGAFGTTVGTAVSTAVVHSGDAGRATVRGAFLLVWILLWTGHASSRESNRQDQLRCRHLIIQPGDPL